MKLNSELRTKKIIFKYRLKWVIFYTVVLVILSILAMSAYTRLDNDNFADGHIELSLNKEKYQVGETIEFTIKNHFPNTIYVPNNCPDEPLDAYLWVNDHWLQVHGTDIDKDSFCYTQPRRISIKPNEELTYHFNDWPDLFNTPGVYRIVMPVEHYDDLPFKDFVVLEPEQILEQPEIKEQETPATQEDNTNTEFDSNQYNIEYEDNEEYDD